MSRFLTLIAFALVMTGALHRGEMDMAIAAALCLGMNLGSLFTFAYRRGTILRLERELAGYREFDEEDEE